MRDTVQIGHGQTYNYIIVSIYDRPTVRCKIFNVRSNL